MYLSEKPRPIDFYKEESAPRDMIIEVVSSNGDIPPHHPHPHPHPHQHQHQHPHQHQAPPAPPPPPPPQPHHQMILGESSGEDLEVKAPKKRAETWVQDETRCLIALRREMDSLFNTSKSNKHLWEQISSKMREKGFDRSPTMCTDKWRNLLKEYKKAKYQDRGSAKMSYYKEIEEILRERSKNNQYKSPTASALKVDPYMQFSDKGIEDAGMTFGPVEASGRPTLNLERRLDHDGHPLAITTAEAVAANGVPPWNWRETPGNGESQSYGGRVISVKWGDYTRRVGIDGTADSIKEAIKSAFRLRTKRAFWLEDEDQVIRSLDRDMPLGNYTLQLDEGNSSACWFWNGHSGTNHEIVLARGAPPFVLVTKLHYTDHMDCLCIDLYISGLAIKVCLYDESGHISVHPEDKIFYTEDDYRDFLARRGWTCLRELDGYRNIDNMDDLRPGGIYRGVT